jgi:hypothetical protein
VVLFSFWEFESRRLHKKYLTDKGMDYGVYDNKYQMPGTELNVLTYGPYAIAGVTKII